MFNYQYNRIDTINHQKKIFCLLVFLLVIGLFLYGYFVRSVIVNIVARQNIESKLVTISSDVTNLETQYIKVKNSITVNLAQEFGFLPATSSRFVSRDNADNIGLSLLNLTR